MKNVIYEVITNINSLNSCIFFDISNLQRYIPAGTIIASVILVFVMIVNRVIKGKWNLQFCLSLFLFVIYLTVTVQVAYLSREPGSRDGIDLRIGGTWGETVMQHASLIENIIMFIPYGFLLPMLCRRIRHWNICIPLACISSIMLESMQYITKRGYCQIDDVITNTLGAAIGYLALYAFMRIFRSLTYFLYCSKSSRRRLFSCSKD